VSAIRLAEVYACRRPSTGQVGLTNASQWDCHRTVHHDLPLERLRRRSRKPLSRRRLSQCSTRPVTWHHSASSGLQVLEKMFTPPMQTSGDEPRP